MNIFMMFIIFFIGIIIHEISHNLVYWVIKKDWAEVKFSKTYIKVIPKQKLSKRENQLFLGVPIISGMVVVALFNFSYPTESTYALIGYLVSCGMDFWNLIKLEVNSK